MTARGTWAAPDIERNFDAGPLVVIQDDVIRVRRIVRCLQMAFAAIGDPKEDGNALLEVAELAIERLESVEGDLARMVGAP